MKSLRKRLVITLLLTLLVAWIGVFTLQHQSLARTQTGIWDQALLDVGNQALMSMPISLLEAERGPAFALPDSSDFNGDKASFQVWSLADKRLLLRSPGSPEEPLRADFGLGHQTTFVAGKQWRVYSITDASGRVQVQAAKPATEFRESYLAGLWRGVLFATAEFLLLAVATWAVILHAFKPVDRAGKAILEKPPLDQTKLPLAGMPAELRPFITSINQLLEHQGATMERERRFLADAAHELRTPLAALSVQAELVARSATEQDRATAIEKLRAVAVRTARLSEQLLDQARTDALCVSPSEPVSLDALSVLIVQDYEETASRKRQRVLLNTEACTVMGSLDALGVLLRNLVDNALRYTPEEGCIAVSCRVLPDGRAELSVADDGPGIPAKARARVFDRFYRVAGSSERGSGIGLSLVSQIAARHAATIECQTGLNGGGLSIAVVFPLMR